MRPGKVLLMQGLLPLPQDAIFYFLGFQYSILSSLQRLFSRKSVSTTPPEFYNAVNMTFAGEVLVLNIFDACDPL